MTLADIIAASEFRDGTLTAAVPEGWMQGRTCFGGLSTALAYHAATQPNDDLPPLRTAQIAFVGPLAGRISIEPRLLRRGRTAAFIRADIHSEAGLGLAATFVFMHDQPSHIDHQSLPAPAQFPASPVKAGAIGPAPAFIDNLEMFEMGHLGAPEFLRWVRLKAHGHADPITELLAVADALPPAALGIATQVGPISSMTWLVNLLTARPQTRDGWWLLRSTAEFARNGTSSQSMAIWNSDGMPVASGMQSVALFV